MPSLPVIEPDQVRHASNAPDGGVFDAPVTDPHEAAADPDHGVADRGAATPEQEERS